MMSSVPLEIFECIINVMQSIMVSDFLIKCLGRKNKIENSITEYITGIFVTFAYLEVLNRITVFESIGIFLYLIISLFFSFCLLDGSAVEKIIINIVMIAVLVFSSLLAGGLTGVVTGNDFYGVIGATEIRVIAVIFNMLLLFIFFSFIIRMNYLIKKNDSKYMGILSTIPVLSVVSCCLVIAIPKQEGKNQLLCILLMIVLIFIINVICLILFAVEHKVYSENVDKKILLSAYEQKDKDVAEIKRLALETRKTEHDISKILTLLYEMLDDDKLENAKRFLQQYIKKENVTGKQQVYCENAVLNYLLNRKIRQCRENNIHIRCFVGGKIDGIEDVDLYILLENLIDNAIEASKLSTNKKLDLSLVAEEENIWIDIGNSTKADILKNNRGMRTTKDNKMAHGFGLQNVKDVVNRNNGSIEYKVKNSCYVLCKVMLSKTIHATE